MNSPWDGGDPQLEVPGSRRIRSARIQEATLATIYKVCDAGEMREAARTGTYTGSADDVRDGFIHFSTRPQLAETLRRHFSRRAGLVVMSVTAEALGDALRWEPSRGGDLFPHLYGALAMSNVARIDELPLGADGLHAFPESLS